MASQVIYAAEKYLKSKITLRHYIPYRVSRNSKYESNRTYFSGYWSQAFRVINVKYDEHGLLENANIRWDDGCYGLICTDLSTEDYRLRPDKKGIYKKKDIVNDGKSYTGAEIAYWFYVHNIDQFNHKYKGFWKWIDLYSEERLHDENRYKLFGRENNQGEYTNCRITRIK